MDLGSDRAGVIEVRMAAHSRGEADLRLRTLLDAIEAAGSAAALDLSAFDLSNLAMGSDAIRTQLARRRTKSKPVWYSEATEGLDLRGAHLASGSLAGSLLWRADLRDAILDGATLADADLGKSLLNGARLRQANLQRAIISGAILEAADLTSADLRSATAHGVDFTTAHSVARIRLANADLDGADLSRAQLELIDDTDPEEARQAYLALRRAFTRAGRFDDGSWVYLKERAQERRLKAPSRAVTKGKAVRAVVPWLVDWSEHLTCGYGERPLRTVATALVVILAFAVAFILTGSVAVVSGGIVGPTDVLEFSLAAFSTINLPDLVPIGHVGRVLASAEALFGIGLLALLMFSLGRRIARA
jgi:uncharacterized protein YjbI with pentapeptide repeats